MRGEARISPIYGLAPGDPPTGAEAERRNDEVRATAWRKHGLLVIDPEEIHDEWMRQGLINLGDKLFGRRGRRK